MTAILGTDFWTWFGVILAVMGFAAFMTGHALASTWRPRWQVAVYCVLLSAVGRFLIWGLFYGEPWLWSAHILDAGVLVAIGLLSHRLAEARKMVTQYPWLYARVGPLSWREKGGGTGLPDRGR